MAVQLMGVLNVTPDSFSDGGLFVDHDAAVAHGLAMVAQGASIIDVGGESTRPGAEPVDPAEEIRRTRSVVAELAARGVRVSIDTRHAEVATAAVGAGASIINDVSASLGAVAAEAGVTWIAMHMAGDPRSMQDAPTYVDVVSEVIEHLVGRADAARAAGVPEVWIDPGIGFGKTVEHNLALLGATDALVGTGYPVVMGVSRKSLLGRLIADSDAGAGPRDRLPAPPPPPAPIGERVAAGVALGVWCALEGVSVLRVHDVAAHVAALGAVGTL